ncbi:MAG: hypothetical protein HOO06_06915 [Bdellovibrionaceae bacterium]|nr:hypothetical protein [Pseudobdellovibrionaceae bacterium]
MSEDESQPKKKKTKILRFRKSERLIHWAIAIPFMVCFFSGFIVKFFLEIDPTAPESRELWIWLQLLTQGASEGPVTIRELLVWSHQVSGAFLFFLPPIVIFVYHGDISLHFNNIKQAWIWTFKDIKWLALIGLATINKNIKLPKQGKFNAGEKINFMFLLGSYPFYIITGVMMIVSDVNFFAYIAHVAMAFVAAPLLFGHIYMAVINPDSRKGLKGMISGYVDKEWARHHYENWFEENKDILPEICELSEDLVPKNIPTQEENVSQVSQPEIKLTEIKNFKMSKKRTPVELGKLHYSLTLDYEDMGEHDIALKQLELFIKKFAGIEELSSEIAQAYERHKKLMTEKGKSRT